MIDFLFLLVFLAPVTLTFYFGGWVTGVVFILLLWGGIKMGRSLIDE
jgi:hypothetical protein